MDQFDRKWILSNAIEELQNYRPGEITVRGLHYRLVSRGMTNSQRHYKRVVAAMTSARWDRVVSFSAFADKERQTIGETPFEKTDLKEQITIGKGQIKAWMNNYSKNLWENQPYYVEVFIEKKALQAVFEEPCNEKEVALSACKGYPSLTFLNEASERFEEADREGKKCMILYFGDYDPSGEDIPRSIEENINRISLARIELKRFALMESQVLEWGLPPAPTKSTDSRSQRWDGLGQVELDAVEPRELKRLCKDAIGEFFNDDLASELEAQRLEEREQYRAELKKYVDEL